MADIWDPLEELIDALDDLIDGAIDDIVAAFEEAYDYAGDVVEDVADHAGELFDDVVVRNAPAPGVDAWVFVGGKGNDVVRGLVPPHPWNEFAGAVLYGGDGFDHLTGSRNGDFLMGGASADTILGENGNDLLFGNFGSDTVRGGAGNDLLVGGRHSDDLDGGSGNDKIFGGRDNDRIIGGQGADILNGEGGYDVIVFRNIAECSAGGKRDIIIGFTTKVDKIDLQLIDANLGKAGDQAFSFVPVLSGKAGEVACTSTRILADIDGGGADLVVELAGGRPTVAADFLL